jgi:glycosyltransferase involved in cell wall biosynthesis
MFLTVALQTRGRPEKLAPMIRSLVETAECPEDFEILLGVDSDDRTMVRFSLPGVKYRSLLLEPGLGAGWRMNRLASESLGQYIFFLNDDVESRTHGWDTIMRDAIEGGSDGIQLLHVNDGVLGAQLCIYPCFSKELMEVIGDPFPTPYRRWWADDHIHNIFYLLEQLGFSRIRYLPEVVFENEFGRARRGEVVALPQYSESFVADTRSDKHLFVGSFDHRCSCALSLAWHLSKDPTSEDIKRWKRRLSQLPCFPRQTIYFKWTRKWYRRLLWPIIRGQGYRFFGRRRQFNLLDEVKR